MADDGLISLDETPPENLLTLDQGSLGLGIEAASRRASEAHVALGEKSPGVDALKARYLSGEGDKDIRQQRSSEAALKNSEYRAEALKELASRKVRTPDDPYIAAHIAGQKDDEDPNTILEKGFADSVIDIGTRVFNGVSKVVRDGLGMDEGIDMTNATRDALAKRKVAQNLIEEDKSNQEATSTLQKGYELLEGFVPGVSWYRLEKAAKDIPAGVALPGQTLYDIVSYANALPPNEYHRYVYQVYDQLKAGSQSDASRFAAALESYSKSDATFDNAMEVLNVAASVPVASISKSFRGALGALTGSTARGVAGVAEKALQTSPAAGMRGFLKQLFRSADSDTIDAGRALSQLGDTPAAARVNVLKAVETGLKDVDPRVDPGWLRRTMPALFNPAALSDGSTFAAQLTERIIDRIKFYSDTLKSGLDDVKVQRGTAEALQVGLRQAEEAARRDYRHLNAAILDIEPVRILPENSATNTGSVSIYLGKPSGELFTSKEQAEQYAEIFYGIKAGDKNAEQVGAGWALRVARDIDETTPEFRKALAIGTDKIPVRMKDVFLGLLRSAEDIIAPQQSAQRHLATHASVRLHELAKTVADDIGTLPNNHKKDLSRVLEANRSYVSEDGLTRGRFNQSIGELGMEYQKIHGRLPTEQETKAYFAYVALNDLDYTIRNMSLYKEKARLGIKDFFLYSGTKQTEAFEGKELMTFPKGMDTDAGLFIHTGNEANPGEYRRLKVLDKDHKAQVEEMIKDGFKLVQIANPSSLPLKQLSGTDKPIHFVLTKSARAEQLSPTQIPYRPGGHKDYAVQHFVKQPIIRRIADGWEEADGEIPVPTARTIHSYEGEKAAFGFHTEAEARKYTERMEKARQLLKDGKMDDLEKYLQGNLPYTADEFGKLFQTRSVETASGRIRVEEAHFNINDPFVYLKSGRRFSDDFGTELGKYDNVEDNIRNPYNLYDQLDKKFAGERDPDLFTVREAGTESNPVFHVESADMVDPMTSISNSMANIMRNRYMTDVKISAIDSWIQQFGDLIKGTASIEEVRANPLAYIYKDTWDTSNPDVARIAAAKNSRRALLNFLGEESPLSREVGYVQEKIANSFYNIGGQGWGKWGVEHLPNEVDPLRMSRKVAFHLTMGLFNPVQLFAQANSMVHMLSLAGPKNGMLGTAAYMPTRALLLNDKPQMVEHFANIASKMGWKKDEFIESYNALKKSGYHLVEGEVAWNEDMLGPKLFNGRGGAILDKATVFFREGERINRLAGWHASYLEWKAANPGKALGSQDIAQIVKRADDMGVNMTRASNAAWNGGMFSVPTQFGSYAARLSEQFLGKRLTDEEKRRAFLTYSAFYGVPIATTAAVPVMDMYGDVRTELLKRGIDPDAGALGVFMNGIPATVMSAISGRNYNINDRFGPGQFPILKTLSEDKTSLELLMGPSGSIMTNTFKSSQPVLWALTSPFRSEETQYKPTMQDVTQMFQSISTVNYAVRTMAALNLQTWMTKNGVKITSDVDTFDAWFTGITGTSPRNVTDTFLKMKGLKDLKNLQAEAEKQYAMATKQAIQALNNKDDNTYRSAMAQAKLWIQVGQFRPDQYGDLFKKAMGPNLDLASQIDQEWFLKGSSQFQQERVKSFTGQNK